jgi:hypothetical protein
MWSSLPLSFLCGAPILEATPFMRLRWFCRCAVEFIQSFSANWFHRWELEAHKCHMQICSKQALNIGLGANCSGTYFSGDETWAKRTSKWGRGCWSITPRRASSAIQAIGKARWSIWHPKGDSRMLPESLFQNSATVKIITYCTEFSVWII